MLKLALLSVQLDFGCWAHSERELPQDGAHSLKIILLSLAYQVKMARN